MKSFSYVITDELGIHARPAGLLCKLVKSLDSVVTINKGENSVDASRVIALMGLGVKKGDELTISVDGGSEDANLSKLEEFFKENL